MKNKKLLFIIVSLTILIIIIFFINIAYKKSKFGNNENNKSAQEIKEYILNINSYTAKVEVTVNSNKNQNKYMLEQEFSSSEKKQTVIKPENIEGLQIIYNGSNLTINNSRMNTSKMYAEYPYLSDNVLWLDSFISEYRNKINDAKVYEEKNEVVIEINVEPNKYTQNRKLYLEKGTGKPIKMVISDNSKKETMYILYNEININNK